MFIIQYLHLINNYDDLHKLHLLFDKKGKGNLFEEFCVLIFRHHPQYCGNTKNVFLFSDAPQHILDKIQLPKKDIGIDVIVETNEGYYHSVQVKFRGDRNIKVTYRELSTFLSTTFVVAGLSKGYYFSNTYPTNKVIKNLTIVEKIQGEFFDNLPIEFFELLKNFYGCEKTYSSINTIFDDILCEEVKKKSNTFDELILIKSIRNVTRDLSSDEKKYFSEDQKKSIIQGSEYVALYPSVIRNSDKSIEDHYVIIGFHILKLFGFKRLDDTFFQHFDCFKKITGFINLMNYITGKTSATAAKMATGNNRDEIKKTEDKKYQREIILIKLLECFFPDGIFDDSLCIVNSIIDLTPKQKEFINENFFENGPGSKFTNKVNSAFHDVAKSITLSLDAFEDNVSVTNRIRAICVTDISASHMLHWLRAAIDRFFGYDIVSILLPKKKIIKRYYCKGSNNIPLIIYNNEPLSNKPSLNKSSAKGHRIRITIKKKEHCLYCYRQMSMKHIEALLSSGFNSFNDKQIAKLSEYLDTECEFYGMHGHKTFRSIYEQNLVNQNA